MSPEAETIIDLQYRFAKAARAKDDATRDRLFRLLDEFEWAYPNAAAEVASIFAGRPTSTEGGE